MNKLEKRALANYPTWKKSNLNSIFSAYKNPSYDKQKAWEDCKALCYEKNGHNLKVVNHGTWFFSAGFEYPDAETGEVMFMYITKETQTVIDSWPINQKYPELFHYVP